MGAIASMTGYGRGEARGVRVAVAAEVRSLNHRFLELNLKLGRGLSAQEPEIRRLVQGRAARGRFDVTAVSRQLEGPRGVVRTDVALGAQYARSARALAEAVGVRPDLTAADLLRLPGVVSLEEAGEDEGEEGPLCKAAVEEAVGELTRMRLAEGAALATALRSHLEATEAWIEAVRDALPHVLRRIQARMRERVEAVLEGAPVDLGRLAQEVATWAAKSDVAEELVRLASHCRQFRVLLDEGGPVGRQLDFLAQELHREVNTIASKADDGEMTARVLEARTLVERIREQVQNVE